MKFSKLRFPATPVAQIADKACKKQACFSAQAEFLIFLQLYKCIKKGMGHKTYVRNGLKDVQSRIRKGEKGLVVFAGDVTPVDVMCHLPAVCEEKQLPYVFTPSRQLLGTAMGVKRGSLMVMIREHEEYKDLFDECKAEIEALPPST